MKRSIAGTLTLLFFLAQPALAEPVWDTATRSALEQALSHNPRLRAAERDWWRMRDRIQQDAALPDPKVMIGSMTMGGMPGWEAGVSQMIPFPGKLDLAQERALLEAQAAGFRYLEERQKVASQLKRAMVELYALNEQLAVLDKNKAVLGQLSKQAIANYAVGKGLQQDVLKAQSSLGRLLDQHLGISHEIWAVSAKIRALIGEAGDMPPAPKAFDKPALPAGWETWESDILAGRPLLLAEASEQEAALRLVKMAEREIYPDLEINFRVADQGPMGMVLGGNVGVTVPVWRQSKQDLARNEADNRWEAAKAKWEAMRLETLQMAREASAHLHHAVERVQLLDTTLIPQAKQTLSAGMTAYQVGKIEFTTLLEHQMALYELERERIDSVADYYKMLADLEALRGVAASEGRPQ